MPRSRFALCHTLIPILWLGLAIPPGIPLPTPPASPEPVQQPREEIFEAPEGLPDHSATDPPGEVATTPDEPGSPEDGGDGEDEEIPDDPRDDEGQSLLPQIDIFFPEGDLDLRINRLVKKVFVEGQVQYNFVSGDITAYLRYRYYGYKRTTQFTVFDEIEFEEIEDFSSDFSRTRGWLLLTQWPHSYSRRTFLLVELDRISSNKEDLFFNNNRTNTFVRLSHQIGTPTDRRSNTIVGEDRSSVRNLFTAFQDIGPGDAGLTSALTWGFDAGPGDFDYFKLEVEGLKRFELPANRFLVGRLHFGRFFRERVIRDDPEVPFLDRFSIPRNEYFRLDGRDNLKGLDLRLRGTEELHTTWELALPWFLDQDRKALGLRWKDWYWVLYGGYGTIGFDTSIYSDAQSYIPDIGVGFETAIRLKDYQFFLSGIVAYAFEDGNSVETRLSLKSYH